MYNKYDEAALDYNILEWIPKGETKELSWIEAYLIWRVATDISTPKEYFSSIIKPL